MMYKSYVSINMLQRNIKHAQHYYIEYVSWKSNSFKQVCKQGNSKGTKIVKILQEMQSRKLLAKLIQISNTQRQHQ